MKEALIDTNVILRLFLGDIPQQTKKSKSLFEAIEKGEKRGIVSILVVNELIWILEHFYQQERKDYIPSILKLFNFKKLKIPEIKKSSLIRVLEETRKSSLDFVDLYLLLLSKEIKLNLITFDKKLKKRFEE